MPQTKRDPWADVIDFGVDQNTTAADGNYSGVVDFSAAPVAPAVAPQTARPPVSYPVSPDQYEDDGLYRDPNNPAPTTAGGGLWKKRELDSNGIPKELLAPQLDKQTLLGAGPSGALEATVAGEPKPLSVTRNDSTGYFEIRTPDGKWVDSYPTQQDAAEGIFMRKYAGEPGSATYGATINDPQFQDAFRAYFGHYPFVQPGEPDKPQLFVDMEGGAPAADPSREYDDQRKGAAGSADAFARGAANFFTAGLADDAEAGFDTLLGKGNFAENVQRQHAINNSDWRQHPIATIAGDLVGMFALPSGIGARAEQAGVAAGTTALRGGRSMEEARAAANIAARRAAVFRGAGEGAAYGGVSGATSAENPDDAVTRGLTGIAIGGAGGAGGSWIGGRFVKPTEAAAARNAVPAGEATMAAADRLAPFNGGKPIDLLPADVAGPTIRRTTGALAQSTIGGAQIINAGKRVTNQAGDVLGNIADSVGAPANLEEAGTRTAGSASNWIAKSGSRIGRIYDTANDIAQDARVELPSAKTMVDQQIARLSAVPGANDPATSAGKSLIEAQTLRKSLEGSFGVQGIRDMRTEMFVAPDFRGTPAEGRMKSVVQAAADDIEAGLRAKGLGKAADAFKAADTQWKERIGTIEQVIEPIIGTAKAPKSGEQVVKNILTAAQGDQKKLARFLDTLDPETRNMASATVINRLGQRATDNAEEGGFSFATFLTNWNKLGPRAKREMFGPEAKAALDDLATVARGTKEAQSYANHSNTGGVDMLNWTSGSVGASMTAFFTGHPVLGVLAASPAAMQAIGGKLLASPRFARWLARAPKDAGKASAWLSVLPKIARAEPAIAPDIFQLQRRLTDAFSSKAPLRAAAQQNQGNSSVPDWSDPQYDSQDNGTAPAAADYAAPQSAPDPNAYAAPSGDPTPGANDGTDGNNADWANR